MKILQALIDAIGIFLGHRIDRAEKIGINAISFKQADVFLDPLVGLISGSVFAIGVVTQLCPIDRKADIKMFLFQKGTPLFIQGKAIGLQVVPALLPLGKIFLLKRDGLFEEIESSKGRLAAMPDKRIDIPI